MLYNLFNYGGGIKPGNLMKGCPPAEVKSPPSLTKGDSHEDNE
jgi:hypothetical protein